MNEMSRNDSDQIMMNLLSLGKISALRPKRAPVMDSSWLPRFC